MKKWLGWSLIIAGALTLLITLGAGIVALDPSQIDHQEVIKPKPQTVKLPDPPKAEEPPPPPEPQAQANLLQNLAPESFSNQVQDLGGIGFGSGGSGPSIGGSGGFGRDAGQLMKNQTSVDRPPRAIAKAAPDYPQEARTRGVSGFVILKIYVGANGVIENVKVEDSEPKGFFDQAAIQAIKSWRFEPAVSKGQTVASWTTQKIKFELN